MNRSGRLKVQIMCYRVTVAVLIVCVLVRAGVAAPATDPLPHEPYCGLYCLYAAALDQGHEIEFATLLQRKYMGCPLGSSIAELKQAALDFGLNATALSNLSATALEQLSCPAILHVRSDPASREYDHFILVLSVKNGEAVVLDPGRPIATVKVSHLLPIWSGTALLVSNRPINKLPVSLATWGSLGGYAVAVCCGLVLVARVQRRGSLGRPGARSALAQASLIVVLVALGAAAYHRLAPDGLFGSAALASSVDAAFAPSAFPYVSLGDVQGAVESPSAALVDARRHADFSAGHVPRALNLPPDADEDARRRIMSGVSNDLPVIVYCQNSQCGYSELVARKLKSDGFRDIRVYSGGLEEWSAAHRDSDAGRLAG